MPWEGPFCGYATVIKDKERYLLYYRGLPRSGKDGTNEETTCVVTSKDGINWQTFSATYNGKNSPLIPADNSHFHSTTQLRFTFTSDASGNDIGYWIDDLVIIYDQAAKKGE